MKLFRLIALATILMIPLAAIAQDHPRRYEDREHHDTHEWNSSEDQNYRRYLDEHHRKYHDFDKAPKREQSEYWKWRHEHDEHHEDRR